MKTSSTFYPEKKPRKPRTQKITVEQIQTLVSELEGKGLRPTITLVHEMAQEQFKISISKATISSKLQEIRGLQKPGRHTILSVEKLQNAYDYCLNHNQKPTVALLRSILGGGSYTDIQEFLRLRQQPYLEDFNLARYKLYRHKRYSLGSHNHILSLADIRHHSTLHLITGETHGGKTHYAIQLAIESAVMKNVKTLLLLDIQDAHIAAKILDMPNNPFSPTHERVQANLTIKLLDLQALDSAQKQHMAQYISTASYDYPVIILDNLERTFEELFFLKSSLKQRKEHIQSLLKSLKGNTELYLCAWDSDGLLHENLGEVFNGQIHYCDAGLTMQGV